MEILHLSRTTKLFPFERVVCIFLPKVTFPLTTANCVFYHQLCGGWNGLLRYGAGRSAQEIPGTHQSAGRSTEGWAADRGLQVKKKKKSWGHNTWQSFQTDKGLCDRMIITSSRLVFTTNIAYMNNRCAPSQKHHYPLKQRWHRITC